MKSESITPKCTAMEARALAMLETSQPAWYFFHTHTSIELHANKAGFEFLGKKFLEMAGTAPGEDSWLPTDSSIVEMGPPVFILRMAGERPPKPMPPMEPTNEEQLKASRSELAAKAASALHVPPKVAE